MDLRISLIFGLFGVRVFPLCYGDGRKVSSYSRPAPVLNLCPTDLIFVCVRWKNGTVFGVISGSLTEPYILYFLFY